MTPVGSGRALPVLWVVEPATPSDLPAIAALNDRSYAEFETHLAPASWDAMRRNVTDFAERLRHAEIMVLREAGMIVGSVAYCPAGKSDPAFFSRDMASLLLL